MKEQYLVFHKAKDSDIFIAFLSLIEDVDIRVLNHQFLIIETIYNDLLSRGLRELSIEELYLDFTLFLIPKNEIVPLSMLFEVIPLMNYGEYDLSDFMRFVSLEKRFNEMNYLKDELISIVGHETIDSLIGFIEHDLNASQTSKALYMHRNTLNYRIDHFKDKTGIDIRHFRGALALYLLFL